MSTATFIGFLAACFTTACFVPQVVKTWRTRSTTDISLATFSALAFGIALWIVYAILRSDLPVLAANAIALGLVGTILVLKLKYG
jgi:MtN3 and saliva related transmembrane protein